jgi:hypothetical protein
LCFATNGDVVLQALCLVDWSLLAYVEVLGEKAY